MPKSAVKLLDVDKRRTVTKKYQAETGLECPSIHSNGPRGRSFMAKVTLQLLEGLERGLMFRDLSTPVTIGREDDNTVRLNDERVSRFHAKIQEDGGQVILTDLESTNGTRINGHPIQMRVLQIGDQIAIGRCLLVYGSPEEITAKVEAMLNNGKAAAETASHTQFGSDPFEGAPALRMEKEAGSSLPETDEGQSASSFPTEHRAAGRPAAPCSGHRCPTFSVTAMSRSVGSCKPRRRRPATAMPCGSAGRNGNGSYAWKWNWRPR